MSTALLAVILAYLLGSLPLAYIAGRCLKGIDIREVGDGNVGSANVIREVGAWAGVIVGLGDIGKGAAAVLLARWLGGPEVVPLLAGLSAMAGHAWPIFLWFRGGIGEATALGVLLVLVPWEILILGGVGGVALLITRNGIISTVLMLGPLPLLAWVFGQSWLVVGWCFIPGCFVALRRYQQDKARRVKAI